MRVPRLVGERDGLSFGPFSLADRLTGVLSSIMLALERRPFLGVEGGEFMITSNLALADTLSDLVVGIVPTDFLMRRLAGLFSLSSSGSISALDADNARSRGGATQM